VALKNSKKQIKTAIKNTKTKEKAHLGTLGVPSSAKFFFLCYICTNFTNAEGKVNLIMQV
jgi:hypothetical protein